MSLFTKLAAYWTYLIANKPHGLLDQPVLGLLNGLSCLYKWGVTRKYQSMAAHPERRKKLPVPVISLGNITTGGTGKTPTAVLLAGWLSKEGRQVALLNRGYRSGSERGVAVMSDGEHILLSAADGGDEALLLARSLPGVPVLVGRERARTGQLAIDTFQADVLLLDDAFQHWQLERDLDIVLVDGTNPFGNGHVLPRGILREPLEQLRRAGIFLITKADLCSEEEKKTIYRTLHSYQPDAPIAEAIHRPAWCISFADWYEGRKNRTSLDQLPKTMPVIAVSALGNPASFEATVCSMGYSLAGSLRFDDHHQYTQIDVEAMQALAEPEKAVIITTEKDAVKLPAETIRNAHLPVWVLGIEIAIMKGKEELQQTILQCIGG